MTPRLIQCDYCKSRVPLEQCEFAAHRTVVNGAEYVFCCTQCAKQFKARKRKKK